MQVRQAQVPSGEASPSTVRKRTQSLGHVRLAVTAGDSTTQLAHELHAAQARDREKLLEEIRKAETSSCPVLSCHESRPEHPMEQTEDNQEVQVIVLHSHGQQ